MPSQITDKIMLVRPVAFHKNEQTAINNYFQQNTEKSNTETQKEALAEFDVFVGVLRDHGIEVLVFDDLPNSLSPDSIFPNNWISLHEDGSILLYPMFAENRRIERRNDILDYFKDNFLVAEIQSFTEWESEGVFLEGTGSLIFDRINGIAYAALSGRTNATAFVDFENRSGFKVLAFRAFQEVEGERRPIYHTNVMMAVGQGFAVICLDAIDNLEERKVVVESLEKQQKKIIEISEGQMHSFAGNILHVKNNEGQKYIVMSSAAFSGFSAEQIKELEVFGDVIHSPIPTIESLGGGGVRCMMAEVFLPKKEEFKN